MATYIHQLPDWPGFFWNQQVLANSLATIRHNQGRLIGRLEALGFSIREEAVLETLTLDVVKSSEIEGEILNTEQVRSSLARKLGIETAATFPADRHVEGVVKMLLDATQQFDQPLTTNRLFKWHAGLFPTGRSGLLRIIAGAWRDDAHGPMEVVSGPLGRERVHYEAPNAARLECEMTQFIDWANRADNTDPVLRSAIAHLWFVTIHPFDDGNGRIARAISDWLLAQSENSPQRFYSMSAQIRKERDAYYDILEQTQKATLDITPWLEWFLNCLGRAVDATETTLSSVLRKARFWDKSRTAQLNDRQRLMLNMMLDDFKGKLTSSKWATLTKCSQDTAHRDIQNLIEQGILAKDPAGGRSTSYSLLQR
jgi:Fic family protein